MPESQYKNTQNHPVLLPETALESNGYIDEALILYALNHDELLPSSRFSNETALIIMVLRFKVAHTYHLLDEKNDAVTRKAVKLVENIEPLYKKLRAAGNIPHEQLRTFIHLSQRWLGHRYAALKDFNSATQAFKLAAKNADDVNEIVENICMAADSLVKLNEKQDAYRLLLSVKDLLEVVDAPDIRKAWDLHYLKLHSSLGGHDLRPNEMGTIRSLFTTINRWVSKDKKPSYEKLTIIQQELKIELEKGRNKKEESIDNHAMLLIETIHLLAKGTKGINEARELLKKAEVLEKEFTEEKPKVERKLLSARLLMYAGEGNSIDEFNTLWSQAQKLLEPEVFLHEHGFYLEALVRHLSNDNIKRITVLVDNIENILGNIIAKQPNSLARRKIREDYQRLIESAVLALLTVAEKVGIDSEKGQFFLKRVWHTILRTRNLDLTNSNLRLESQEPSVLNEQRRLEDEFHKHLNEHPPIKGENKEEWRPSLNALFDYEASSLKTPQYSLNLDTAPPVNGISLVFFEIKDLISNKPMLILGHQNGHFHVHLIKEDFESHILKPIDYWRKNLEDQDNGEKISEDETVRNNAESAAMSLFFPIIQKLFHNSSSQLAPFTLHLFPDSSTSSLNFEILPPFLEGKLKNYFNIQIHLRSSSPEYNKVNLSQGWLALGDIPKFGELTHLAHALKEIEQIEHILEENGYLNEKNKRVFLDEKAHAGNLAEALETLKPSVVHITAHGDANICLPEETSYLVLADNQGAVEGSLLPFRTIQRLNFSSVDLVVLSVCSGAVGASSRSEGLRGLTWAFLAAGAKQVIASRYPVEDEDTAKFMPLLYEYLVANYPVSEALRLTRNDCLQIPLKISKYQVGAWGLWI